MADNSIFTTIAKGVERGESLPVIVRDRNGKINSQATARLNRNNSLFNAVQDNAGFTLGKLSNALLKLVGNKRQRRVISAATEAREQRPDMAKGGVYKGKKHSYAAGGAVKDMKIMRTK